MPKMEDSMKTSTANHYIPGVALCRQETWWSPRQESQTQPNKIFADSGLLISKGWEC